MKPLYRQPLLILTLALTVLAALLWSGLPNDDQSPDLTEQNSPLTSLLGGLEPEEPFPQVSAPRPFDFPADHLEHPEYQNEWWYFTGHLKEVGQDDYQYGFQFTLFRHALAPPRPDDTDWASNQIYMGHLALTDFTTGRHMATEIFSRKGPDLAGTALQPPQVWVKHWRIQSQQNDRWLPLMLEANAPELPLKLALTATSQIPPVLQGIEGYSPKSPATASYYYSYTHLEIFGTLSTDNKHETHVTGQAWFDHEWSSSYLESDQKGWDWFSLQLDNGMALMLFEIRSPVPELNTRTVTLTDANGQKIPLTPSDVETSVTKHWQSPSGRNYPAQWRLRIPSQQMDVIITPRVADQEMRLTVVYWEGAVQVKGTHQGVGYVELSGYQEE
ncbi:hypothetical protein MIB92_02075 [Aestuariirhabdus sp. Z084]|uniref:lipocalin-like domain-containing protein n=1 Tax=Aestuariirhabdus haliotis TaxID=2918751 RepID=UPI00201B433F|nr:lipocalin-like domain-containing protein [Aestuariirhabdus haliotis]MCL6414427.1 hypothetical protein [Aestuariirhabdus haliotis]MCL6418591.1 hypothetical protein [Aestuariirhabdus haliotis]